MPLLQALPLGPSTMASATVSSCFLPLFLCCVPCWVMYVFGVTVGAPLVQGSCLVPWSSCFVPDLPTGYLGLWISQAAFLFCLQCVCFVLSPPVFSQVFWLACTPAHPTQRLSHMLLCPPMSHRVCQVNARWAVCHEPCAPYPSTLRCFAASTFSNPCFIITVLYFALSFEALALWLWIPE